MAVHVRDNRGGNWAWFHNAIIDDFGPEIGPYGIAVYVALCRHAGQDQSTFVGQRTLAQEIGGSRAQVHRELKKLEAAGLVRIEEETNARGQTTNTYLLLPIPETPRVSVIRGALTQRRGPSQADDTPSQPDMAINKTQRTRHTRQPSGHEKTQLRTPRDEPRPLGYERFVQS